MARTRISLDFTKEAHQNLVELQSRQKVSTIVEVFRKALALYDCITAHLANGGKVILQDKDGENESLKLL